MLSIHPSPASTPTPTQQKSTPHLLPCRINHNGPINNTSRFFRPFTDEKGTQHVHFRGRHLHGTTLPLPAGYTGAVLDITDKLAPQARTVPRAPTTQTIDDGEDVDGDEEMEMEMEEVKVAEQIGEFDSVVVWGHGGTVEEGDAFLRGMKEWVGFAEAMHCDEEDGETQVGKSS